MRAAKPKAKATSPKLDWSAVTQVAIESCTDPLLVVDRTGRIQLTNRAFGELVGWDRYDVLQKKLSDWLAPSSDAVSFGQCLNDAFRGVLSTLKCHFKTKAGDRVELELSLARAGEKESTAMVARATAVTSTSRRDRKPIAIEDQHIVLDCEVMAGGANFGQLDLLHACQARGGDFNGKHCYEIIANRNDPCPTCPLLYDSKKTWPKIKPHPPLNLNGMFQLASLNQIEGGRAKLTVFEFSCDTIGELCRDRVRLIARGSGLTGREHEVLDGILSGNSPDEVSTSLNIAPRTVRFHQANILRKLEAENKFDLFRLFF